MDFWGRVKEEIKRQNTTQEWVSGKAGIILGTMHGWISKGRLPDVQDAQAIAHVLGVTVEYLVTGADSTDPWIREHRQLIDDLKILPPDKLEEQEAALHAIADLIRARLGKSSASGGSEAG
jgi:transcriptional regulator with XRE-family HTH domain